MEETNEKDERVHMTFPSRNVIVLSSQENLRMILYIFGTNEMICDSL